jgi:hypothetical protein
MGKTKEAEGGGAGATSSNVYVLDKEFAWVPARLLEQSGDVAKVSIPSYPSEEKILCDGGKGAKSWKEDTVKLKFYPGKALPMQNVDKAGNLLEKEDMVELPFLHEVSKSFKESFESPLSCDKVLKLETDNGRCVCLFPYRSAPALDRPPSCTT